MTSKVTVVKICKQAGQRYFVEVSLEQWLEFQQPARQRRTIQEIFPELSADQREFIKSGHTPAEWNAMFGEME